jgi:4-amino-4-deoxy-L-arabinose transferase-like glycosyltransferase
LALRVIYVLVLATPLRMTADAYQYHHGANLLADGWGFIDADKFLQADEVEQTATHPPLYTLVLAAASKLGLRSVLAHQLWSCLFGTGTIAVMGVLGQRLAGPVAGLAAAYLVAFHPDLWVYDGLLLSEPVGLLAVAVVVLVAYRLWEQRTVKAAVGLGVACALAALARAEASMLLPLLLVALVVSGRYDLRRHLRLAAAGAAAGAVVLAPWVGYNLERFRHPVLATSTGFPLALVQGNCDAAYYGSRFGSLSLDCIPALPPGGDETDDIAVFRRTALDYIKAHATRVPAVVLAREGRAWGVFHPLSQLRFDSEIQRRDLDVSRAGLYVYWVLVLFAFPGALILHRRGVSLVPLLALLATVAAAVALTFGSPRYRVSGELALGVMAAATISEIWRRGKTSPVHSSAASQDRFRPSGGGQPAALVGPDVVNLEPRPCR